MQISITVEIPENEMQRKLSKSTKNPEMTEEWWDTDSGVLRLRSHRNTETWLGNTSAWNWQNVGINDTDDEQGRQDNEK